MHIPKEDFQDFYVWGESSSGEVKDIYSFILKKNGQLNDSDEDKKFWHNFLWRLFNRVLALSNNLRKRNIWVQSNYYLCN